MTAGDEAAGSVGMYACETDPLMRDVADPLLDDESVERDDTVECVAAYGAEVPTRAGAYEAEIPTRVGKEACVWKCVGLKLPGCRA